MNQEQSTPREKTKQLNNLQRELIEIHREYAHAIAKKINHSRTDPEEICAAADLALCKAALNFDAEHNTTFRTYLFQYVVFEVIATINQIRGTEAFSVDDYFDTDNTEQQSTPPDQISTDPAECPFSQKDNIEQIHWALSQLNKRDRNIIELLFGINGTDPLTVEDTAATVSISERTIYRLLPAIYARLRSLCNI